MLGVHPWRSPAKRDPNLIEISMWARTRDGKQKNTIPPTTIMICGVLARVFHPSSELLGSSREYEKNFVGSPHLNKPCKTWSNFNRTSNINSNIEWKTTKTLFRLPQYDSKNQKAKNLLLDLDYMN